MTKTLTVSQFDPGSRRIVLDLPEGLTVAEIVSAAVPHLPPAVAQQQCRVALVSDQASDILLPELWHRVRPRPGARVIIRVIADKLDLRTILTVVVAIAAVAAGQYWAGTVLGLESGTVGYAVAAASAAVAVTAIGTLLINALIPPATPERQETRNTYQISGWRNELRENGSVPVVLGTMRYAPPFGALPYTEIVGDDQYVRGLFIVGEGQVLISDVRIGETSIADYRHIEIGIREGLSTDAPFALVRDQAAEARVGVELTRPLPRDDRGDVISGEPAIETPVVRNAGADAAGARLIFGWPSGLFRYNDKGGRQSETVSIRIDQRPVTAEEWQLVVTLEVAASKSWTFYRSYEWRFPTRGRWQVRCTLLTPESTDSKIQRRVSWAILQTLRPEYPIAYDRPLAGWDMRVMASYQLSGQLDNVSGLCSRICWDWDHVSQSWVWRATRNPASLYRHVLQSGHKPVPDSEIDLDQLRRWHDFCRVRSLTYDSVAESDSTTVSDILREIAAAGRALPRHDGARWTVTIDEPQELIVDHLTPRSCWDVRVTRTYVEPPHAFRVRFRDASADYQWAERIVRWPGYDGPIELTEALSLPGLTDPAIVWREARRRQYEVIHRPDIYTATQQGALRVATRGDKVLLAHHLFGAAQRDARVKSVVGSLIELDETVTMEAGQHYGLRYRVFESDEDTVGTSVLRIVTTQPGETKVIVFAGPGPDPRPGSIVLFGSTTEGVYPVIVTRVEATEDGDSILSMVDEAPQIDQLLDADEIPEWTGRVGAEIPAEEIPPSTPRFTAVASGVVGTGTSTQIDYLIEAGTGAVPTASFEIDHRLAGGATWTTVTIPVANGGGSLTSYAAGQAVELRARGLSVLGIASPYTPVITVTIGEDDAAIPAALDPDAIEVTAVLGGAVITLAATDPATTQVQVYRSTTPVLNRDTDAVGAPYAAPAGQTVTASIGDTTRVPLVSGTFTSSDWTAGAGWSISGGAAVHSAGTADAVARAVAGLEAGKWYRIAYRMTGRTAGSVTPRLTGGYPRPAATVSADGLQVDRIQAVTGNDAVEWLADADFDGTVSEPVLYLETTACLAQGTHYVWIEPLNADDVPGPVAGPYALTII
ncbi:hypothetical protein P7L78_09240 [Tistrella bauzanensis]|uniref:TipJ family phage tail tip protein n=1 Tax=Tistrella TaxID=171436 RepID=UPI0031F6C500